MTLRSIDPSESCGRLVDFDRSGNRPSKDTVTPAPKTVHKEVTTSIVMHATVGGGEL